MKKSLLLLIIFTLAAGDLFGQAIPKQISYQGVLKDAAGNLLTGNYQMSFSIYNEPTGGTALWTEVQTVSAANGVFSAELGSTVPIATVPFDKMHFLGISLGGTELSPRTMLCPSPYSFMAINIMDNSITTDKIQNGAVSESDIGNYAVTTDKIINGGVTGEKIADGTITSNDIGSGQVVKTLNGLMDNVILAGGTNVNIVPSGNTLTINAAGGGGGTIGGSGSANYIPVFTDATTLGNSPIFYSAPLVKVNTDLVIEKNVNDYTGINIKNTSAGSISGEGIYFENENGTIAGLRTFDINSVYPGQMRLFNNRPGGSLLLMCGSTGIKLSNTGNVGIGIADPEYPLHVSTNRRYSGYFTSDTLSGLTHVIHAEYTGTQSFDAYGVYGKSAPADNYGYGGYFIGGYQGIYSRVESSANAGAFYYGVYGSVGNGPGNKRGVQGTASGTGTNWGIYGYTNAAATSNYGVYGFANGATTNYAGYFSGNVHVNGTLSKTAGSFKIDHPLDPANKYLYHSFVESPDMKNIYDGNVTTDASGYAAVKLPDWFEALNKDFRYQLTVIGDFAQAIIAQEIRNNEFVIRTNKPNIKVSWLVTGIRHDKYAEKYRIPVEEMKSDKDIGKYLNPDAFGQPESMGIDYENNKVEKERPVK